MANTTDTQKIRLLDRELTSVLNKLKSQGKYENSVFVPDMQARAEAENLIGDLSSRIYLLTASDNASALLKRVFEHFLEGIGMELGKRYTRPAIHMGDFVRFYSDMARLDSRCDSLKAELIVRRFDDAPMMWRGIREWIDFVEPQHLIELRSNFNTFISAMDINIKHIDMDFPDLKDAERYALLESVRNLAVHMHQWDHEVEAMTSDMPPSSFPLQLDTDKYEAVLKHEFDVDLTDLLKWYNTELEKTRAEVFEAAGKVSGAKLVPMSISKIYEICALHAGPCASLEEMISKCTHYLSMSRQAARDYVRFPDTESLSVSDMPEHLKAVFPWGGYNGGCPRTLHGEMMLNGSNFQAVTDVWLKIMAIHEAYPGHHLQFVRTVSDRLPEVLKLGVKPSPMLEGTAQRSESIFDFVFEDDPYYSVFVAYRRHQAAVRVKADILLGCEGWSAEEVIKLYMDELGIDHFSATAQVKSQIERPGYFTGYCYGLKKLTQWQKQYGYDDREYTELLFSAGSICLTDFESFLRLSPKDRTSFTTDYSSIDQFGE